MAKGKNQATTVSFNDQLILFRYFLQLFGRDTLKGFAEKLNDADYEGYDENHNTYFYRYLDQLCITNQDKVKVSRDKLRQYDDNICRYVKQIGEKRGDIVLKYFQYMALLFTEMYLDRYFSERDVFIADLNEYIDHVEAETLGKITFEHYTAASMNKLAFMCATGSGKTLIMHINILQFLHYLKRAQRLNSHLAINKIIVLAPNEGMSLQHLEELKLSSIAVALFQKDKGLLGQREDVLIIDMNKLKEEGKVKTVSVDSFEQNNLVLVDEAHRGLSGDVWKEYRDKLSMDDGFAFEYSATFKQALKALNTAKDRALLDEYCKSIIMDYSYKFFYEDGYGKEYRIYNLREGIDEEQRHLYLTGCLLTFYQQLKLFEHYSKEYAPYEIQKPLLVFVGNRVTATTTAAELTDVEEVLDFIDKFVRNKSVTIERIRQVLEEDTGLMDGRGKELFSQDFNAISSVFGSIPKAEDIYADILRVVFNSETTSEEPRLHMENLRQVQGEIALKIGEEGEYFGVISIGDTVKLVKNCDEKGIVAKTEEFVSDSLFQNINSPNSNIKVLVGSRKFTEGWNSWRVSTMGLINFAKGEGSQAIQLFGRGVRLRGYHGCLKRSSKRNDTTIKVPQTIHILETLTIFGVKAQYMEDFRRYLELEEMPTNDNIHEFTLPVISRYDEVKDKKLKIIKVREGADFKRQAKRLILEPPDEGFLKYLGKHKIVIDCRSKVQTIDSGFSLQIESTTDEYTLEKRFLPYIDYTRIYEELEAYKVDKYYHNITIDKTKLQAILETDGWYSLIIPQVHIKISSMEKLEAAADYCVMVLKSYMDKFYKYKREEWEAPRLEYQELAAKDNNFVQEYSIAYTDVNEQDTGAAALEQFIHELSALLEKERCIPDYQKGLFKNSFIAFDFQSHLFAPLLCLKADSLQIQVSPVSMNEDEKRFVDMLKIYTELHKELFNRKNLYLLRNKSKVGMGFFEAGNFYPDYVLWIDMTDIQYVSFIDPKGLMKLELSDPKIEFYSTIKILEERLQPTSKDKKIVLNSFIMSATPPFVLKQKWNMGKPELEEKHVLCLDNDDW
jgi:hypothetical protein